MARRRKRTRQADIVVRFAAKLRELRRSHGMTQAELAAKAHMVGSYIGRLEAGGAAPGIDLVARLADALGTTVHELLPLGPPPNTEAVLRSRAEELFAGLLKSADRDDLLLLTPLLARLGESPVVKR